MPHDIFISYSTANQAWAESALQLFESQGFSCWMAPRDIRPGTTWATEIVHGISDARVMLLLLSSASNQSRQVAREVQLADSSRLRIVPVLLEPVQPEGDFIYFISNTQWVTALGGFAGDHAPTLLAAVREALNPPAPAQPNLSRPNSAAAPAPLPNLNQYRIPQPSPPLSRHPLFWMLLVVGVLLLAGVGYLIFRPASAPQQARQPVTENRPEPPGAALVGTWTGAVGTSNTITLQVSVPAGQRLMVLVDNPGAQTVREPAKVLVASGGFLELDMGEPPRARCNLHLSSDRRNLEGTWTQNKTKRTFKVVFSKVE